jgi:hypothetical protein
MSQYPPPPPPSGSQGFPPNYPPNIPPNVPPGYGGAPGGGGYPPGGGSYPPGFQAPPGYSLPSMSRLSGAAVASLVCGLIFCIPGITGLVAIITGIVGIAETAKPQVRGRGMAIAGLILGILSLGGWAMVGVGGAYMYHAAGPQRAFARTFVNDLAAGKVDQCAQNSDQNLTADKLDSAYRQMQGWGALQDVTIIGFNMESTNSNFSGSVSGICRFPGGTHNFLMMLVKDSSGQLKADSFVWQN